MNEPGVLRDILALAVHAPSGDNSQPWKFKVLENSIELFNVPDGDGTLYNHRQRGSYVSHGAVIENILLCAEAKGLKGEVFLFPGEKDLVARINLSEVPPKEDPLCAAILSRVTNRKPYNGKPLAPGAASELVQQAAYEGAELRLVEDRTEIDLLSKTLSLNERLLMENRTLHDFLFNMIRWTSKEERERPGLFVRTMEFPPPVRLLLRFVVVHWKATLFLNKIGLSKNISKETTQLYKTSSAFGAIIIKDDTDASFIQGGQALQRVWLKAEILGIRFQPVTALPYLRGRIEVGETETLSRTHIEAIDEAYTQIAKAFSVAGSEKIAMLFRLGYGDKPTAQSFKLPPKIIS